MDSRGSCPPHSSASSPPKAQDSLATWACPHKHGQRPPPFEALRGRGGAMEPLRRPGKGGRLSHSRPRFVAGATRRPQRNEMYVPHGIQPSKRRNHRSDVKIREHPQKHKNLLASPLVFWLTFSDCAPTPVPNLKQQGTEKTSEWVDCAY